MVPIVPESWPTAIAYFGVFVVVVIALHRAFWTLDHALRIISKALDLCCRKKEAGEDEPT